MSQPFKTQLRIHARSATYPDQPQAARLMEYCTSRGDDLGPVCENFGSACDQLDRADAMLIGVRERATSGCAVPKQSSPETDDSRAIVLAHRDPESQTVTPDPRCHHREYRHVRRSRSRRRAGSPRPRG
jgi:hypothetical protein